MTPDRDTLMEFAVQAAREAGEITRGHFGVVAVETKGDGSEVTAADREAELYLRDRIAAEFPEHAIFGEEGARVERTGIHRWIIDPIDGTRSFASGVPLYGILLALEEEGVPVLGCAHFPELGETVVAAAGAGCWRNGRRATVSACDALANARVVTSGLEYWRDWASESGKAGFTRLLEASRFSRTWGDCFGYILVATGRAEILADPASGAPWDYAPMVPIITEAGGRYSAISGDPVTAWSSALATNSLLHASAAACWGEGIDDLELQTSLIHSRRSSA